MGFLILIAFAIYGLNYLWYLVGGIIDSVD